MDKYIGLDIHTASCSLVAVGNTGRVLARSVVETKPGALVQAMRSIRGTRWVCIEECNLSAWIFEVLSPHAELVVVTRVEDRKRGRQKDDYRDALELAQRMRTGNVAPVYKPGGKFKRLSNLARTYRRIVVDHARVMNRLKALYQSQGLFPSGAGVYNSDRAEWYEQLSPCRRPAAELHYRQYDALAELRQDARRLMLTEARTHPICKVLLTAPGLGKVRVAMMMPIVANPHRFRTCRQFWSYSGLGIMMKTSSDWTRGPGQQWVRDAVQQTRGLNKKANRVLKDVFKGAANTIVKCQQGPLYEHYCHLTDGHTKPNLARLTIARRVAAITLAMWKNKEAYDPSRLNTR
jgi:transposase